MRSWHVDERADADYGSVEFWDEALLVNAHDALALAKRLSVSDDFERTNLGAGWTTSTSLSTGRIQLTSASGAASDGTRSVAKPDLRRVV